jgi:uncharacterized membrane protein
MATLTVLTFPTAEGADQISAALKRSQQEGLITIQDAAIVSWPTGASGPKTRQLYNLAGIGALAGSFWGLLFGLLFFIPLLGLATGATLGALFGAAGDVGIDDKFIVAVRGRVTKGTSALFLLTSGAVIDRLREVLRGYTFEIMATNLSVEEEEKLREIFAA